MTMTVKSNNKCSKDFKTSKMDSPAKRVQTDPRTNFWPSSRKSVPSPQFQGGQPEISGTIQYLTRVMVLNNGQKAEDYATGKRISDNLEIKYHHFIDLSY